MESGTSSASAMAFITMRHQLFLLLYLSSGVRGVGPKNPSASAPGYSGEAAAMFEAGLDSKDNLDSLGNTGIYGSSSVTGVGNFNFMTPGGVPGLRNGGGPSVEECRVKNLKQQERMTMAKLDAHRCLVRDTVVAVPPPETLIAQFVHPSHVVVQRCTGLCLERPGCECVPKKTRQVKVDIVVGVNSSSTTSGQLCSSIEIEEHRGPCKCKCLTKSCHYNMVFDREACLCRCKDSFSVLKRDCLTRPIGGEIVNYWDEETCTCKCKPRTCVEGHYQDRTSCECKPVVATCSATGLDGVGGQSAVGISGVRDSEREAAAAVAATAKYVGLGCVVMVALAMILSLYYLMVRKKGGGGVGGGLDDLTSHHLVLGQSYSSYANETARFRTASAGSIAAGLNSLSTSATTATTAGHPVIQDGNATIGSVASHVGGVGNGGPGNGCNTAYTITINSHSPNTIDDAVLPLTVEDKTRF